MAEPFDPIAYRNRLLTASQRNDRPYFPPPQPVVPEPTTIGQEFVGAAKRALSGIPSGIGQVAADLPVFDQNNALQRYGQGVVERNPTDIQGLGDIVDRPGAAVAAAAGSGVGSMTGMAGARLAGMGITAASPLFGPAAPVVAGIGQAVANVGPLASLVLPAFASVRGRQIENDPAAAESLGSKLIAAPAAVAIGAVERLGGGERILEDVTKGGIAALGTGSFWRNVGRLTARGAREELREELVQSPIEQIAAGENPLKPANLQETAFQSAMGALGGGAIGGTFGAFAQRPKIDANTLNNDDLGKTVDDALATATTPRPSASGPQQMDFGFPVNQGPQADMFAGEQQPAFAPEQEPALLRRAADQVSPTAGGPQQDFGFLPDSGPQGQLDLRAPATPFTGIGIQQDLPLPEPAAPILSQVPKDLLKGVPQRVRDLLGRTSDPDVFLQRLQDTYRAEIQAAENKRSSPKWLFGEDGAGGRLNAIFAALTGGQDIEQPLLQPTQQPTQQPAVQAEQTLLPGAQPDVGVPSNLVPAPPVAAVSDTTFPSIASVRPVSVGPMSVTPRGIAPGRHLYRETNGSGLDDLLLRDDQPEYLSVYVSDNPDLALGQRENQGVEVVFRPDALSGERQATLGTSETTGLEYTTDILAPRAVQQVTLPASKIKSLRKLTRLRLTREFDRQELAGGLVRFVRKGLTAVDVELGRRYLQQPAPPVAAVQDAQDDLTIQELNVPPGQTAAVQAFLSGRQPDMGLPSNLPETQAVPVAVVPQTPVAEKAPTKGESARKKAAPKAQQPARTPEPAAAEEAGGLKRFKSEEAARAEGFTLKAYRGVSAAAPFNDSGTTWATTKKAVAEAYADEVFGYEDAAVITLMVNTDGLPTKDIRKLTENELEALGADEFGNPQAPGIYEHSDDHTLGNSAGNVTVIHAPNRAVAVIEDAAGQEQAAEEAALKADKAAREATGTRAPRGEKPQGVATRTPEGRQTEGGEEGTINRTPEPNLDLLSEREQETYFRLSEKEIDGTLTGADAVRLQRLTQKARGDEVPQRSQSNTPGTPNTVQGGEEGQVVPQPEPDTRWLSAREQTLRDDLLIKEMTTGLTENENALLQRLESKAQGESGPQFSRNQSAKATIDVDGVQRPTTNSEGRPIHPTEDGVRNFWRWFGDSKVVDGQGRPLVVYHGTRHSFDEFKREGRGGRSRLHYFSSDPSVASEYAGGVKYGDPNVVPVFLSLQNPFIFDAGGATWGSLPLDLFPQKIAKYFDERNILRGRSGQVPRIGFSDVIRSAVAAGYDGVIADNIVDGGGPYGDQNPSKVAVATRPEQIKSAIGNQGTFDPNNPGINRSGTQGTTNTVQSVVQAISDFIGQQAFKKLHDRFVVVRDWQQLQEDMVRRGSKHFDQVDDTVTGLYDPSTETSYVVANRVGDNPVGVFLHEVGEHYGLERMLGRDTQSTVLQGLVRLLRQGGAAVRAAAEQVNEHENLGLDPQSEMFVREFSNRLSGNTRLKKELLGYLVENPDNHQMSLVQRIFSAAKAFLVRMGWKQSVDVGTLVSLVTAAARKSGEFARRTQTAPQVSNDPQYNDAVDALRQFGYEPRTVNGVRRIVDANGDIVTEADMPEATQLAATVVLDGPMFSRDAFDVTQTPAFKRWFGDSKVVDAEGRPLVMYHGTREDFTAFETSRGGAHFGTAAQANMRATGGSKRLVPTYLAIRKPLRTKDQTGWSGKVKRAIANGYDGIVYLNRVEGISLDEFEAAQRRLRGAETLENISDGKFRRLIPSAEDSWIAFRPEQIKSAIGNQGTFDPNNPNIMFSRSSATGPRSQSTEQTLNAFGQATDTARQMYNRLRESGFQGVRAATLKTVVKWADRHHLVEMYDKLFNGALRRHATTYDNQEVVASRFNQMFNDPYRKLEALHTTDRKRFETISNLMRATELRIDPRKSWEQHEHLHDLKDRKLAEAKRYVAEFRQMWGRLSENDRAIYNDLVTMNETMFVADMVVSLQNAVRAQVPNNLRPEVFREDVTERFRNDPDTHTTLQQAKAYWDGRLTEYRKALGEYIAEKKQALGNPDEDPQTVEFAQAKAAALKGVTDPKLRKQILGMLRVAYKQARTAAEREAIKDISPLEAHLTMLQEGLTRVGQSPYFHMGRFGDYFVGFRVKVQEDKTADEAAMARVSQVLQDKFPDVVIRSDSVDPNVFARFESHAQADEFRKAVQQLGREGLLHIDDATGHHQIVFGKRSEVIDRFGQMGPQWLSHIVENIRLDEFEEDAAQQVKNSLFQVYIDSLPNTSAAKTMVHRKGRPGFNADMVRSYAHRMRMASTRIAGLSVAAERQDAMRQMRDTISSEGRSPVGDLEALEQMQVIADEMTRRDDQQIDNTPTPVYSILRSLGHTFYLGMSPAYVLTQITQLGAMTWPELTKKYGSRESFNAMVRAAPIAFKIVTTAVKEGYKAAGVKGGADMVLSADILAKAGVSSEIQRYLTEVMGTGKLDIGNASRELARIAEGEITGEKSGKFDEIIRMATATSYGSELLTRLIASLAVRQLAVSKGADSKAVLDQTVSVLDESMLNYNYNNLGRMTGRQGIFGPVTPVVLQFHQYQFQLLGKLYREIYRAFGERDGVTAEQKAEARKFLKSHAAAMVLLAGTTGLPFLTAALAALDQLCELFSDQPCDSRTGIRNLTSDIVGTDIEPIISRGVLRVSGGDISSRIGEADILPFSRFLADRRTLAEKIRDPAISVGAAGGMISGMVGGAQKMAEGDLLAGMQQMIPVALQGPVKALRLVQDGFVDQNGNKLPITPHGQEVLLQLLGVRPGQEADYSEARRAQTQRSAILNRETAVIRRNFAKAFESGDQAAMREWLAEAQTYDARHPGANVTGSLDQSVQQRARARAMSSAFGLPIGTNVRDLGAMPATRFFQPQGAQ